MIEKRIFHIRPDTYKGTRNNGGITIVAKLLPNHRTVFASFSVCNENDNFSRKVGRAIAEGRLKKNRGVKVAHTKGNFLIDDILNSGYFTRVGISQNQLRTFLDSLSAWA